jgi:hypothetical protein
MTSRPRPRIIAAVAVVLTAIAGISLTRADAPAGRYVVTTSSVQDTVTGLVWERAPAATMYTTAEAQAYCTDLFTPDSDAWRLPTFKELQTLVDESRSSPTIDLTAFPGAPAAFVWSVAPTSTSSYHLVVDFNNGETAPTLSPTRAHVRCVR